MAINDMKYTIKNGMLAYSVENEDGSYTDAVIFNANWYEKNHIDVLSKKPTNYYYADVEPMLENIWANTEPTDSDNIIAQE